MNRPLGITILGGIVLLGAVILFLMSIASFIVGLAFLLPFTAQGTTLLWNGLLYLVIAIALAIAGSGLMRMRPWAWGLGLLAALVTFVYVAFNAYQRSTSGDAWTLSAVLTLAILAVIAVYLVSVYRSFRGRVPTT